MGWDEITTLEGLVDVVGGARERANKARPALHALDREWLAASPFCLIATSAADGTCDVSPKGDPAGFTYVIDDRTIALPERPGNKRVDGYRNVTNGHVGLIFLIPGRGDTLRINGRARLLSDAPFFDQMLVKGHRPILALVVEIEEVFHHCSKAFLRSRLWEADSWQPGKVAPRPVIAQTLEPSSMTLEQLTAYYGPSYAEALYATNAPRPR